MTKAGQCAQLGGRDCQALRERAARLESALHACLKAGKEWVGERCE